MRSRHARGGREERCVLISEHPASWIRGHLRDGGLLGSGHGYYHYGYSAVPPRLGLGGFRLVGSPLVSIEGRLQPDNSVAALLDGIREGIREHGKAGPLWDSWHVVHQ